MIIEEIMEAEAKERERIAKFLRAVFDASTHGASGLMERAIRAVEENKMSDPNALARSGEVSERPADTLRRDPAK